MIRILLLGALLIYYIVTFISKGMSFLQIIAYVPLFISISAAVFCTSQGIMFVASIISGILAYILSHSIGAAIGITFILIIHTMIHGE